MTKKNALVILLTDFVSSSSSCDAMLLPTNAGKKSKNFQPRCSNCHVISHGDDRNKIDTILPSEWTVATHQKSDR